MPSVCPVLPDVFLSVVEGLDSLPLPDAGPELPGEDVTGAGPEHPPAVLEAAAEASCVVVAVVVDGGSFPALHYIISLNMSQCQINNVLPVTLPPSVPHKPPSE